MSKISSKLLRDDPAAYYTELGAELERERIIKLLEVEAHNYDNESVPFGGAPIRYCIQLLKGEHHE